MSKTSNKTSPSTGLQQLLDTISASATEASQAQIKKIQEEIDAENTAKLKDKILRIQNVINTRVQELRMNRLREKSLLTAIEKSKLLATQLVQGDLDAHDDFENRLQALKY